jgi:histidinol-phosphatase (PHP family)
VIVDYHVHTPYCGHAQGKMVEYIEAAIHAGISELGFSDHLGRYYLGRIQKKRYWDWGMSERDLDRYFIEALELKELFADRITIRVGLEVDYIEGAEDLVQRITNRFPYDYLLGSIHCIPNIGWRHLAQYAKSGMDPEKIYALYFSIAKAALESGLFQSLAHVDFVWRYLICPKTYQENLVHYISDVVSLAKKLKTDIEINSNGYLWSQAIYKNDFNPFNVLVNAIGAQQATITLGSDAHAPQAVAKFFPEIISLLKNNGITWVSVFNQKKKSLIRLG